MNCLDENTLVAMIEHALDPISLGELEAHIDSCEQCRSAVAALAPGSLTRARTLAAGTQQRVARASEPTLAPGTTISDRYVVRSVLGRGGMGTVYLAHDTTLDREVALKLHRAGSGDRLHREAVAMAKLAHPNVVTVFEVATLGDRVYVAMEYVRGTTLRGWLGGASHGWRDLVALLLEVGRGLAAAHAAGLVHRDFKPENVLVGDDGRPRVGDFGLARVGDSAVGPGASAPDVPATAVSGIDATLLAPASSAPLTATGAVLGTPAYMAPEQFDGGAVDARCDQFAFCVVAWECLHGRRPFSGATVAAVQLAIEQHALPRPASSEVPERVRRVLGRGLASAPGNRYPDMTALLAALRRAAAPRTRRRAALAAAAALVLIGTATAVTSVAGDRRRDAACVDQGDRIRHRFDGDARLRVQRAFTASGSPFAASSFDHVSDVLARYAGALGDQATALCRGKDRDESARLTLARRACVADRATELTGLVDALGRADASLVQRATDAAWAIFDPAPCTDDLPLALATSPAAEAQKLARVKSLSHAGQYREAIALATPLAADAQARGDGTLELAALLQLGQLRSELDPPEAVAPIFHRALAVAETQSRDLEAAIALENLASLAGVAQHEHVAAHRFIDVARAKLARLGGRNRALHGKLLVTEGQVLLDENRLGEGEAALRAALAIYEQLFGADHPSVGAISGTLSQLLRAAGKGDAALAAARRTLEIVTRALGADHPTTAGAEMTLAQLLTDAHQYADARVRFERADAVFLRVYGPDHPVRAAIHGNLGQLEHAQQHWDAALAAYRTALGIVERSEGADSGAAAGVRRDLATTLLARGQRDDAADELHRAIAIYEARGADGADRLAGALIELAEVELARNRPAQALPIAERALGVATARPADANPADLADARFVVARALWDSLGDRARARTLAEQATKSHPDRDRRAAIDAWLGDRALAASAAR